MIKIQAHEIKLWDQFAGEALRALIPPTTEFDTRWINEWAGAIAHEAYLYADAMIAERRNKT